MGSSSPSLVLSEEAAREYCMNIRAVFRASDTELARQKPLSGSDFAV